MVTISPAQCQLSRHRLPNISPVPLLGAIFARILPDSITTKFSFNLSTVVFDIYFVALTALRDEACFADSSRYVLKPHVAPVVNRLMITPIELLVELCFASEDPDRVGRSELAIARQRPNSALVGKVRAVDIAGDLIRRSRESDTVVHVALAGDDVLEKRVNTAFSRLGWLNYLRC